MLDTGAHLSALAADSEAFASSAAALDRPVPTCPGWTVADLVGHLGSVYDWAERAVAAGGARPSGSRSAPPADRGQLPAWFAQQRRAVLDALDSAPADRPAWNFSGRDETFTVGWWRRRQAMETAIHLFDLQLATTGPTPIDADLAADGVDEMLTVFLPSAATRQPGALLGVSGTLHLHSTDADGEWVVDFDPPVPAVSRRHTKADAAVRGPAAELFLWVWNRRPLDVLEVFGRAEIAARLSHIRL